MLIRRVKTFLIGGALTIGLLAGGYWYISGLHDEIRDLSIQRHELTRETEQLGAQLEQNIVDFQNETARIQESMEAYAKGIEDNQRKMTALRRQLRENETQEVQECLYSAPLSDAALDRLFGPRPDQDNSP